MKTFVLVVIAVMLMSTFAAPLEDEEREVERSRGLDDSLEAFSRVVDLGSLAQAAVDQTAFYYDVLRDGIKFIWEATNSHRSYSHMINFDLDSNGVWQSNTLQDGDKIKISRKPKNGAVTRAVKFTLKQPNSRWWKALTSHSSDNKFQHEIVFCQDDVHVNTNNVEYRELLENYIVLSKAKVFGVHHDMYWIQNSYDMVPAYEWEIEWQQD